VTAALLVSLLGTACVAASSGGRSGTDAWQPAARCLGQHPARYKTISRTSFYLTACDGVKIAVDLSLPGELKAGEKIPLLIRQTRYYRSFDLGPLLRFFTRNWPSARKVFVERGYAWVDVDVRGTGASFGRWPYPWSPDEIRDGAVVVDQVSSHSPKVLSGAAALADKSVSFERAQAVCDAGHERRW